MKPQNDNTKSSVSQGMMHYNSAHVTKEIPFNLTNAILYFAELEATCDDVIQKQDELIRNVTIRCRDAVQVASRDDGRALLVPLAGGQADLVLPAKGTALVDGSLAPMASHTFVLQATDDEAEDIEQLEFDIIQLRQRMRAVEDEIVNHDPLTPMDMAKKMKFLAGLVADGGEVDMHAFARLVETGGDMLLAALGEVGFF